MQTWYINYVLASSIISMLIYFRGRAKNKAGGYWASEMKSYNAGWIVIFSFFSVLIKKVERNPFRDLYGPYEARGKKIETFWDEVNASANGIWAKYNVPDRYLVPSSLSQGFLFASIPYMFLGMGTGRGDSKLSPIDFSIFITILLLSIFLFLFYKHIFKKTESIPDIHNANAVTVGLGVFMFLVVTFTTFS